MTLKTEGNLESSPTHQILDRLELVTRRNSLCLAWSSRTRGQHHLSITIEMKSRSFFGARSERVFCIRTVILYLSLKTNSVIQYGRRAISDRVSRWPPPSTVYTSHNEQHDPPLYVTCRWKQRGKCASFLFLKGKSVRWSTKRARLHLETIKHSTNKILSSIIAACLEKCQRGQGGFLRERSQVRR